MKSESSVMQVGGYERPKYSPYSLVVFYFVANEKSMTAAAKKLCLTQPAVTHHIKRLEEFASIKLLDVRKKKVYLTHAGEGLFKYAAEVYQQLISAERFVEDMKEASLSVGISLSFCSIVASAASAFEEVYPHVRLMVRNTASFEVAQSVLNSQLELGVVVSMDYEMPQLRSIAISAGEKIVFVASPSSPIFQKEHIELRDLCVYPMIVGPETSATRRIVVSKLEAAGLKVGPLISVEVNSVEWGIRLIESGRGIGFYYINNIEKEVSEGLLRVIPLTDDILIGVDALVRKDAFLTPIAERFISLVKKAFQNHR